MGTQRVLAIGFELASADVQHLTLDSKASLLDWDIVLLRPQIDEFTTYASSFQGKPSLGDAESFRLKECCEHWRREIKQAVEAGKTVIVYLSELEEVFVDTGERSYSGTGRNQKVTRHVDVYNNYRAIPANLTPVTATGNTMKLATRGAEILAPYWAEFADVSQYQVILSDPKVPPCIVTRTGDKPVGALYRSKASAGTLLLLPDIDFYSDSFIAQRGAKKQWTHKAEQFAGRMLATVVALDRALRSAGEITPEPAWAVDPRFALATESALRVNLLEAERALEEAQKHKEQLRDQLRAAGAHRALLFEKGKPLENAIIEALRILGFAAAPFRDSESEFDVVFESAEGRLIGEAEGKDNKAVNIDKLRQLALNVHEDFRRETVTVPAKAVLFGNGFRLQAVDERPDPFTEKCLSAAVASAVALVFTPDLFRPVQYLLSNDDREYASACRQAILSSTGRVAFPTAASVEQTEEKIQAREGP